MGCTLQPRGAGRSGGVRAGGWVENLRVQRVADRWRIITHPGKNIFRKMAAVLSGEKKSGLIRDASEKR
jgi:hypothetical protein